MEMHFSIPILVWRVSGRSMRSAKIGGWERGKSDYQEESLREQTPESRFTKLRIMEKYAVRLRKGE
jgi:hypothetical protein